MDIRLYREYCKSNIAYKIYVVLYNSLVDIANAPSETWTYPFGKEYEVCCERHTIDKAKQAIRTWKELLDDYNSIVEISEIDKKFHLTESETVDKIKEFNEKFNQSKFSAMRDAITEISKAKPHYFQEGLFDGSMRCYNDETIDVAKNCLERISKYME